MFHSAKEFTVQVSWCILYRSIWLSHAHPLQLHGQFIVWDTVKSLSELPARMMYEWKEIYSAAKCVPCQQYCCWCGPTLIRKRSDRLLVLHPFTHYTLFPANFPLAHITCTQCLPSQYHTFEKQGCVFITMLISKLLCFPWKETHKVPRLYLCTVFTFLNFWQIVSAFSEKPVTFNGK